MGLLVSCTAFLAPIDVRAINDVSQAFWLKQRVA